MVFSFTVLFATEKERDDFSKEVERLVEEVKAKVEADEKDKESHKEAEMNIITESGVI